MKIDYLNVIALLLIRDFILIQLHSLNTVSNFGRFINFSNCSQKQKYYFYGILMNIVLEETVYGRHS